MADLRTSRVALAQQLADKEGLLIRAQIKIQKMGQVAKTLSDKLASTYLLPLLAPHFFLMDASADFCSSPFSETDRDLERTKKSLKEACPVRA
jgi:hypothetical protein